MSVTNSEIPFATIPSIKKEDQKKSMEELERKKLKSEIAYYKSKKEYYELENQKKKAELEKNEDSKRMEEAEKPKNEPNKGIKGFFQKLGDAVIKAVPHIISVVVTTVIGIITRNGLRKAKAIV